MRKTRPQGENNSALDEPARDGEARSFERMVFCDCARFAANEAYEVMPS
jgi:hypothetical protein